MNDIKKLNIINQEGEVIGNYQLNSAAWYKTSPLSSWNVSLANRYYLSNQRKANSKTKSRGEIRGSTRKIYKQKGSGRARHGHRYAPQFRGGGVAFGPTGKENYSLAINKKFKKNLFQSALREKVYNEKLIIVDNIKFNSYKTKEATSFLNSLSLGKNVKVLIVFSNKEKEKPIRAFRNLPWIDVSESEKISFLQVMLFDHLIFTSVSFSEVENRLSAKAPKMKKYEALKKAPPISTNS